MNQFVFKKNDSIGAAAAEHDSVYLDECFVDTGDLDVLLAKNPKRILLGRTGTGKTALLHRLSVSSDNVIQLSPHDLSLNFIATNKVIAFFEEAGVNLAPFYVLLWKHLLVVELIKTKYHINDESSYRNFMSSISALVRKKDRNKELAIDYFQKWGNKFWQTTEQRIHELTSRVEESLKGTLGSTLSSVNLSVAGAKTLTQEQRSEVKEHGLDAVSRVQIRELENMLTVLEENIFNDKKKQYYVTIDMLDEDWADLRIKYKLIRSLIDVVNRFQRLSNIKIILAMRHDLLYRVINFETVAGFQEEKYKTLYLSLTWSKQDLIKVIENRINKIVKSRYTKSDVSLRDVFPAHVDNKDTFDYMLERTFYRPRDIIMFTNDCLDLCADRPQITAHIIKEAESTYSQERLQSVCNEWNAVLPDLLYTSQLLYGMKSHFQVNQIAQDAWIGSFEGISAHLSESSADNVTRALYGLYFSKSTNFESARNYILREFYAVGFIGIKTGPTDQIVYTKLGASSRLTAGQIRPSSTIYIHPMFYRSLGIRY